MNKQEYLNQLQLALANYDKSLQEEILNDYLEHFSIGSSEGKSEAEIIASLGDVRALIDELGEPKPLHAKMDVTQREQKPSTPKCKKVHLDSFSADVRVVLSPTHVIKANYENFGSPKEQLMYQFSGEQKGDTFYFKLDVKDKKPFFFGMASFGTPEMSIELELPSGLESLHIQGISGDISLDHLAIDSIMLKTVSGDITIDTCTVEKTEIITTSGDIDMDNMSGMLSLKTVSGDATIDKHLHGDVHLHSASGDLTYDGNSTSVFANTVSGDIDLTLQQDSTITTNTVSGDTKISLPPTTEGLDLSFTSLSGEFTSYHPHVKFSGSKGNYQFGLPGSRLTAKSVSGDIDLH